MSSLEMKEYEKENNYGPTDVAEHSLNLCTTEGNLSIQKKHKSSGHVSFGTLGFMNLSEIADQNSNNSYRDDIDGEDRIQSNDELDLNDKSDNVSKNVENSEQGPLQISEHQNLQISEQQTENEFTPAPRDSNKRKRVFGSTSGGQKKRTVNSTKNVRIDLSKKIKEKQSVKKSKVAKKKFKNNFLTIKFKLSSLQQKVGEVPDFALIVKDNVHEVTATNSAKHAGKYLAFVKGDIGKKFLSEQGISYNPEMFYLCENEID